MVSVAYAALKCKRVTGTDCPFLCLYGSGKTFKRIHLAARHFSHRTAGTLGFYSVHMHVCISHRHSWELWF